MASEATYNLGTTRATTPLSEADCEKAKTKLDSHIKNGTKEKAVKLASGGEK